MRFITNNPSKSKARLKLLEEQLIFEGSDSMLNRVIDELTGKEYLVKIPRNLFDQQQNPNQSVSKEILAVMEKIAARFYKAFSPKTETAEVNIIELDDGTIAIASEFIDFESYANSIPYIKGNDIVCDVDGQQVVLDSEAVISMLLSGIFIDDYDVVGGGYNAGFINSANEHNHLIYNNAKIDPGAALKFALLDENLRSIFSTLGIVTFITKKTAAKYTNPDERFWTNFPLSMIDYQENGAIANKEFTLLNGLLKHFSPNFSIKDLLFGKITYSSIIKSQKLFKELSSAVYHIASMSNEELWKIIDEDIPNNINSVNTKLIKEVIYGCLIIRREQLKHLYLLEYEFAKLGLEKGEPLSFQQMLAEATKRADYSKQLKVIKDVIDNLASFEADSTTENNSSISTTFKKLALEYKKEHSFSTGMSSRVASQIISDSYNKMIQDKLLANLEDLIKLPENSAYKTQIIETIIAYFNIIEKIVKEKTETEEQDNNPVSEIYNSSDSEEEYEDHVSYEDIKLEDNFIIIKEFVSISMQKANAIVNKYYEIVDSIEELELKNLLLLSEKDIVTAIINNQISSGNLELLFSLDPFLYKSILSKQINTYLDSNSNKLLCRDGNIIFKLIPSTLSESKDYSDDASFESESETDVDLGLYYLEHLIQTTTGIQETKTSLLLYVAQNNNFELAKVLIEFGACLTEEEIAEDKIPLRLKEILIQNKENARDFSELLSLGAEQAKEELNKVIIAQAQKEIDEDHDFIHSIIESIIDMVETVIDEAIEFIKYAPINIQGSPKSVYHFPYQSGEPDFEPGSGGGSAAISIGSNSNVTYEVLVPIPISLNGTANYDDSY